MIEWNIENREGRDVVEEEEEENREGKKEKKIRKRRLRRRMPRKIEGWEKSKEILFITHARVLRVENER